MITVPYGLLALGELLLAGVAVVVMVMAVVVLVVQAVGLWREMIGLGTPRAEDDKAESPRRV